MGINLFFQPLGEAKQHGPSHAGTPPEPRPHAGLPGKPGDPSAQYPQTRANGAPEDSGKEGLGD